MRQYFLAFFALALAVLPASAFAQTDLSSRLKGYFLLSVEDRGKIWYVLPETGERVYIPDAAHAWSLIKDEMIGISNANLEKLPEPGERASAEGAILRDRLKGQFLLAVESKGEVWFVNPHTGFRHYLGSGESTYKEVKNVALGIKLSDLNSIAASDRKLAPSPVMLPPAPVVIEAEPIHLPVPAPVIEEVPVVKEENSYRRDMEAIKARLENVEYKDAEMGWEFANSLASAYEQFHRDQHFYPGIEWFENVFEFNQPIYMDETGFTLSPSSQVYWEWNEFSDEFFRFYYNHFDAVVEEDGNLLMHFVLPEALETAQHGSLTAGTYFWGAREGLMTSTQFAERSKSFSNTDPDVNLEDVDLQAEAARVVAIVRGIQEGLNDYVAQNNGYPIVYNQPIKLGEGHNQLSLYNGFGEPYGQVLIDHIPNPGPTTDITYDSRIGGKSYAIRFTLLASFRDYRDVLTPGIYEARPNDIVKIGDLN